MSVLASSYSMPCQCLANTLKSKFCLFESLNQSSTLKSKFQALLDSHNINKMSSKTTKDPQQIVLKYMRDQNRPFSTNDVMMNLHKEFGKTAIQKALDTLVSEGQLVEKVNGKQKAYVINQENLPTANEEELASLDAQIKEAEGELR